MGHTFKVVGKIPMDEVRRREKFHSAVGNGKHGSAKEKETNGPSRLDEVIAEFRAEYIPPKVHIVSESETCHFCLACGKKTMRCRVTPEGVERWCKSCAHVIPPLLLPL